MEYKDSIVPRYTLSLKYGISLEGKGKSCYNSHNVSYAVTLTEGSVANDIFQPLENFEADLKKASTLLPLHSS